MIPDISEFSYGFALTNELVGWVALSAAPVFPSLIEEGKKGGGYDVKLDRPGAPLYLQFKRAECMMRASAYEIKKHGLPLDVPFYRFPITQRNKSFQHTSLVELDDGTNLVFYAAPRFHTINEINRAWQNGDVSARSIFVAPSTIGLIHDNEKHAVSYDRRHTFFCSEPREIKALSAMDLAERIQAQVSSDSRPVRDMLPEWLDNIRERRSRARDTQEKITAEIEAEAPGRRGVLEGVTIRTVSIQAQEEPVGRSPEVRSGRRLSAEEQTLREISDEAMHGFGAQFFVVQPLE